MPPDQLNKIADTLQPTLYEWARQRLLDSNYFSDEYSGEVIGILFFETLLFAAADIVFKLVGTLNPSDRNLILFRVCLVSMTDDINDDTTTDELIDELQLYERIRQYQAISKQYNTFKQILKTQSKLNGAIGQLERTGYAMRVSAALPRLEQGVNMLIEAEKI